MLVLDTQTKDTGWIELAFTNFDQLALAGDDLAACQKWLDLNQIDTTTAAVAKIAIRAASRVGQTMFVVEIERDDTSRYIAHVRAQPLILLPPPPVRQLFRASSAPL
jgi:hypothetical protein